MKTTNSKRSIIRYTRILSNEKFYKTKQHPSFRQWLSTNMVWVCPMTLSSSSHVKVGWLLRSHPTYTNFNRATSELMKRIGKKVELELSPHTILHTTTDRGAIRKNVLKVVTTTADSAVE